ncbi:putative GNAT family acetyltransferase [Rosellinia necatrix]|uniref:Putative GNAT family acetyltransferase n=1 Tax=Rosellinia necatrix TaxID=77044 RepID=A0A1W2TKS9_ROSNE|nr:putative GNAT family acetyltransferase [Rosellinia necatrix]
MREVPSPRLEDTEADVDGVWPDPADRAFMAGLWEDYVKPRSQAVRESQGEGVYVLELLAVHPGYQRLGAGAALVTWGTMAADELQVKAVVEGTPAGRRVYEKCGLRVEIEEMPFDLLQGFTDRAKPKLAFMTREPVP